MIKSAKEALATYFGSDMSDMKDYEYQPGRFIKTVYVLSDGYYCATKNLKALPQPLTLNSDKFVWNEIKDIFVNKDGWRIFKMANE